MSDEEGTSFYGKALEKVGEGIGRGVIKAIGGMLLAGGIFAGSVMKSDHDAHQAVKTEWPVQVGQHLQDLVDTNVVWRHKFEEQAKQLQALQDQIDELKKGKP